MSRVTHSAANSLVGVMNTVTTTTDAICTTINVLGNSAQVLKIKSDDWVEDTRIRSIAHKVQSENLIIDEVSHSVAARMKERATQLQNDPVLAKLYGEVNAAIQGKVDIALGRAQPQPAVA